MYVYLSVENIMSNIRTIMVYVFVLDLLSIEKLIQFNCCKGHLNKALIDQKHVYIYCLFATGSQDERIFVANFSSKLKPGANKKKL